MSLLGTLAHLANRPHQCCDGSGLQIAQDGEHPAMVGI